MRSRGPSPRTPRETFSERVERFLLETVTACTPPRPPATQAPARDQSSLLRQRPVPQALWDRGGSRSPANCTAPFQEKDVLRAFSFKLFATVMFIKDEDYRKQQPRFGTSGSVWMLLGAPCRGPEAQWAATSAFRTLYGSPPLHPFPCSVTGNKLRTGMPNSHSPDAASTLRSAQSSKARGPWKGLDFRSCPGLWAASPDPAQRRWVTLRTRPCPTQSQSASVSSDLSPSVFLAFLRVPAPAGRAGAQNCFTDTHTPPQENDCSRAICTDSHGDCPSEICFPTAQGHQRTPGSQAWPRSSASLSTSC